MWYYAYVEVEYVGMKERCIKNVLYLPIGNMLVIS